MSADSRLFLENEALGKRRFSQKTASPFSIVEGSYTVRVKIITGSLVILETFLFPPNYHYRYRLEIRMNLFNYHYRHRLGVRSHPIHFHRFPITILKVIWINFTEITVTVTVLKCFWIRKAIISNMTVSLCKLFALRWPDSRESIRRFARIGWFARIGTSSDSRESAWCAIKIGVSIANDSRESIRANRVANRPCH